MSEADQGQEKSHEPTPSRIQKARRDGEVAISPDTHVALIYLLMFLGILLMGGLSAQRLVTQFRGMMARPDDVHMIVMGSGNVHDAGLFFMNLTFWALPILVLPIIAILLSLTLQNALVMSPKRLKVQLSRISPIANAKKKYGPNGLVEFAKTTAKLTLILVICWVIVATQIQDVPKYALIDPQFSIGAVHQWITLMIGLFTLAALIVAFLDLPWQKFQHTKKLRMTFQELKEETKQNEGDPHLKQARRERAQAVAQNKMMQDVPTADVIIVNPTHYAVALKWTREPGTAPVCVAKGVDAVAARIREIAAESGVPIHRDPPTARSIHASVEIGQEIDPEHYAAAAAAIHFAEAIKRKAREAYGR